MMKCVDDDKSESVVMKQLPIKNIMQHKRIFTFKYKNWKSTNTS